MTQNLFNFVSEVSENISSKSPGARTVLVGGSAFQFHFPEAHASADADLSVRLTHSKPKTALIEEIMQELGFNPNGKVFSKPGCWFTVEFVSGFLEVGAISVEQEVEIHRSPNEKKFLILSPTAMIFDRLAAFVHWRDASSLLVAQMAAEQNPNKINWKLLAEFLKAEQIYSTIISTQNSSGALFDLLKTA